MSRPARPGRGALLQVSLSRSETTEWHADPTSRAATVAGFAKLARQHGRRFLELTDARGARLRVAEVTLP